MPTPFPADLVARAQALKLVAFDVDGVLTDGRLTFDSEGRELKTFHARDGHGLKLLQETGLVVALITARNSAIVDRRAQELGIPHVIQGSRNKRQAYEQLLATLGIDWQAGAFMGDDLPDLAILVRCGLAMTVPEAPEVVRSQCHWISPLGGGRGAVRRAVEMILECRHQWQEIVRRWQD